MHKSNEKNALSGQDGRRIFAAVSLVMLLAGVTACSTNYTPGNGHPTSSPSYGTGLGPSSLGSSSGTEGVKPQSEMILAPELITPMYSSASEAAGVLAGHQGRFLGYANPGPPSPDYGKDIPTGQVIPPAMYTNPEQTVNSSISSQPTPVITTPITISGVAAPVRITTSSSGTVVITNNQ